MIFFLPKKNYKSARAHTYTQKSGGGERWQRGGAGKEAEVLSSAVGCRSVVSGICGKDLVIFSRLGLALCTLNGDIQFLLFILFITAIQPGELFS